MTHENGSVVFESRYSEVEPVMQILDEWMKEHPEDEKLEVAKELYDTLDIMHMSW